MDVRLRISESLAGLSHLTVKDCERCYEVRWKVAFGILIHKESTAELAEVNCEANPYNPVSVMVPWENLKEWCVANIY
ncbi:hypothetical protein D9M68_393470 [compost metagenome]